MKNKAKARKPAKTSRAKTRRKARMEAASDRRVVVFPHVMGKVIGSIQFSTGECENMITIDFSDRTALTFEIYPDPPVPPVSVAADYSDWSTGNWRPIKRWPRLPR